MDAILDIVLRYLHVMCAIIMVGGMIFISLAVRPALKTLEEGPRESFQQVMQRCFHLAVYLCFVGLLISGVFNWMKLAAEYKQIGPQANAVIGIKFLLAVIVFGVIAGRTSGVLKLSGKVCHMLNLHLVAIIILLAAVLRYWRISSGGA